MKKVSLTVHRNTVENRRKRVLATELQRGVEKLVREEDIRAYAVVGINSRGKGFCLWDTGGALPMWAFPDTVSHLLRNDLAESGVVDDWRPTLPVGGSKES